MILYKRKFILFLLPSSSQSNISPRLSLSSVLPFSFVAKSGVTLQMNIFVSTSEPTSFLKLFRAPAETSAPAALGDWTFFNPVAVLILSITITLFPCNPRAAQHSLPSIFTLKDCGSAKLLELELFCSRPSLVVWLSLWTH